jgi:hypothetical protein
MRLKYLDIWLTYLDKWLSYLVKKNNKREKHNFEKKNHVEENWQASHGLYEKNVFDIWEKKKARKIKNDLDIYI